MMMDFFIVKYDSIDAEMSFCDVQIYVLKWSMVRVSAKKRKRIWAFIINHILKRSKTNQAIFGIMKISEQKLSIIERLIRVRNQETLIQIEALLIRAEMNLRASESINTIESGEVIPLNKFTENNQVWLKKKASK